MKKHSAFAVSSKHYEWAKKEVEAGRLSKEYFEMLWIDENIGSGTFTITKKKLAAQLGVTPQAVQMKVNLLEEAGHAKLISGVWLFDYAAAEFYRNLPDNRGKRKVKTTRMISLKKMIGGYDDLIKVAKTEGDDEGVKQYELAKQVCVDEFNKLKS